MTKEEALQEFGKFSLDGFEEWDETPLYTTWEDGDIPNQDDPDNENFDQCLDQLKLNFPKDSDISALPGWCQIYLLLSR